MKPVPKLKKFGYALFIRRKTGALTSSMQRVGFLFNSSLEASKYREERYPNESDYTIQAVRVNVEPISQTKEDGGSYETKGISK